jgi:hypothetical protein
LLVSAVFFCSVGLVLTSLPWIYQNFQLITLFKTAPNTSERTFETVLNKTPNFFQIISFSVWICYVLHFWQKQVTRHFILAVNWISGLLSKRWNFGSIAGAVPAIELKFQPITSSKKVNPVFF